MMNLIGEDDSDQLSDTSKKKIRMKSFPILGFPVSDAVAVLEMIERTFHDGADFVSFIPFLGSPDGSRIGPEVLFRINVDHPTAD